MELKANENKNIEIKTDGILYNRYAIKTHHIMLGENYINIINQYVKPVYMEGDFITISEKIISLCQENVIYKKDMKIGNLAKFLSKFAMKTEAGIGVDCPYKMQFAINKCGKVKVLFAAILSAIGKIFHKNGIFYKIVGKEVSELDGFYGKNFPEYSEFGILLPKDPNYVCNKIYKQTGIKTVIIDANDFGVDVLGKTDSIEESNDQLKNILKDNPSGQSKQQTPIILVRKPILQKEKAVI